MGEVNTSTNRNSTTNQLMPAPILMPNTRASWKFVRGAMTVNSRRRLGGSGRERRSDGSMGLVLRPLIPAAGGSWR